jgi:hypothetical protein
MLFYILLSITVTLALIYWGILFLYQTKHYALSALIRLSLLGLFAFVIFEQYNQQHHLIIVLLSWAIFEAIEQFYRAKIAKNS